ncbi:MAG: dephospho-CoA kinase [Deltaproteobacteria bacterium]|nr:dephospho-CoA kinase [Deltaproteobacteria bacterium]MBW2418225.1 dephospho-CoA kinase [Deltaproteobacteria bacterium]
MAHIIGLSGGIGSGKSTVLRMLAELGATVIDADAIVHELQAPGAPLLTRIAAAFGDELIRPDGSLDREGLGAIVFRDDEARQRLNAMVHPAVGAEMARRTQAAVEAGTAVIVLDIPLLYEGAKRGAGASAAFDFAATVLVWVPPEVQVERTVARDGCDRGEARRRMQAQLPIDEKRDLADYVIDNSGTPAETEEQVRALYRRLTGGS